MDRSAERDAGGPFIQLGTYSVQSPGSTTSSSGSESSPSYGVFWSDTALKYEAMTPVRLSRPGDLIAFDMTRGARGWKLNVHDVTVGWSRSIEVDYGGSDRFSQAEWVQEDPASGEATTTDVPYPLTSTVAFEDLEVDHRPPHLGYSRGLALSTTSHVFLVPSRPHDDGFAAGAARARRRAPTDVAVLRIGRRPGEPGHEEDLEDPTLAPLPTAREITATDVRTVHLLAGSRLARTPSIGCPRLCPGPQPDRPLGRWMGCFERQELGNPGDHPRQPAVPEGPEPAPGVRRPAPERPPLGAQPGGSTG